ncbi:hypothetical protein Clacol_005916 [Clathrus columnatus]|uniref:Uncharacterized protein n=1 Tax=Clathrus columnatus TaxID=1419009 RepID=A0AAV5AIB4_9AGAM|nr:hypothetical protein Clacol_005916 [Clathrus columnatus]
MDNDESSYKDLTLETNSTHALIMTTFSPQAVNPLLSGMDKTILAQLQTYIETAINVGGTEGIISAVNVLPTDSFDPDQILELGQQGAAMSAGIARTTGSLKNLPGPVSHEDGIMFLNSYKEFQVKLALLFATSNVRLGAFEQGAPGICEYCFNRLIDIVTSSISPNEAQAIHNDIQSVCDDSLTRLHAATSK